MFVMFDKFGNSELSPLKSPILLEKVMSRQVIRVQIYIVIIKAFVKIEKHLKISRRLCRYISENLEARTHRSVIFFKTERLDGRGPSKPLAIISL